MPDEAPAVMLPQALAYASRGWAVLPLWWPVNGAKRCGCADSQCGAADPDRPGRLLGSPAKHPVGGLVPHGKDQATTDAAEIARWWTACPSANVGVRTGADSDLVVLDVDGAAGEAALRELVLRHGRLRAAWAWSGSGGWHAYMAHPGGHLGNSVRQLGEGLDVRGDGGFIVAPPSLHVSGRRYRWLAPLPAQLPPVPRWLAALLDPPPSQPPRPLRLDSAASPYVVAAVEGEAHDVANTPAGRRNDRLYLAALKLGSLVGAGLVGEAGVTATLLAAAHTAGLGEHEARATVARGLEAGKRRPRDVIRR